MTVVLDVALADMAGGGLKNIDPGFELLKKLKPSILTFYTQHAQLAQLFTQGDVVMASWTTDRAQAAIDGGAPLAWTIPKESAYIIDSTIGIAKGTKKLEAAQKYVNFVLSTEAQSANARHTYLSPVNREVKLPGEIAQSSPSERACLQASRSRTGITSRQSVRPGPSAGHERSARLREDHSR